MGKILTIIVPSYNMEAYLPKCLGSLVIDDKELLQKLDVIVVNDGSKDHTSEIAHEFEVKHQGVFKVIDKTNGNYGSCINAALPLVAGKFVKVLDADDTFSTLAFARFVKLLGKCDADLVISDYDVVDEEGRCTEHRTYDFPVDMPFTMRELATTSRYLSMHAYAYRTEVIHSMGYHQLEGVSYSDSEWALLPLIGVRRIAYCPETVYLYLRGRAGQTMESKQIAKNFWMRAELALDMLKQFSQIEPAANPDAVEYVRQQILSILAGVYRGAIFGNNGLAVNLNLKDFDTRLKREFPLTYEAVSGDCYCRKIPYRYIRDWRKRSLFRLLMVPLCKTYSWLIRKTR